MDKKAIFNHYAAILDEMLDDSVFFSAYLQRPYELDRLQDDDIMPAGLEIHSGATRACFIDENYDWVVKIDIDEDRYGSSCEREVEIYNAAKQQNLEKYLAEVGYLGTYVRTINFYDIYDIDKYVDIDYYGPEEFEKKLAQYKDRLEPTQIQICLPLYGYRKADFYYCSYATKELENAVTRIGSPLRSRDIHVATSFVREYGMDAYREFSEFGLEWNINDLHTANIGSIDGHFCIIDYSGYHSEDSYNEDDDEDINLAWKLGWEDCEDGEEDEDEEDE